MNFESNTPEDQFSTQWQDPMESKSGSTKSTSAKPVSSRIREKAADEAGERLAAEMKVFNHVAAELKSKRDLSLSVAKRRKMVVDTATELFGVAPCSGYGFYNGAKR